MGDFVDIYGIPVAPNVGVDASYFNYLNTPLDVKLCNFYHSLDQVIVETIPEYLARTTIYERVPGITVTILYPKDGYVIPASYPITTFKDFLSNFIVKQYAFIDGIEDDKFVELISNYHIESDTLTNLVSKTVTVTFKKPFKNKVTCVKLAVYRYDEVDPAKFVYTNVVHYYTTNPFYDLTGFSLTIEVWEQLTGVIVDYCFIE